jgi:hypothetical protein
MQESEEMTVYVLLGLAAGFWSGCVLVFLPPRRRRARALVTIPVKTFTAAVGWYVATFGFLSFLGPAMADWFGMATLATGFVVLIVSAIIGTLARMRTLQPKSIMIWAVALGGAIQLVHAVLRQHLL